MTTSVYQAAEDLYALLRAPVGAVNAFADAERQVIRVLVAPEYWLFLKGVPSTFEGYRVLVEKREPALAH